MTDQIESYSKAHETGGERGSEPKPLDLPTEAQQHIEQAYAYEAKGDYENTLRECDLAIQLAPAWAEPHNLRGICLDELGRKEEAIAAYRKAVRHDPALSEAQVNLAEAVAELRQAESKQEPIVRRTNVHRPWWVYAVAIWIALWAVLSAFWPGIQRLEDLSQIDWTAAARRLDADAGALESVYTFTTYWLILVGVVMFVSIVGVLAMKKWGTVAYWLWVAIYIGGSVMMFIQPQGEPGTLALILLAIRVAIGFGLVRLWRDGELT